MDTHWAISVFDDPRTDPDRMYCVNSPLFTIQLNFGGEFKEKPIKHYKGGKTEYVDYVYPDRISVDLVKRTCAYRVWQISGIPCVHATSAILYHADKVETHVDGCYKVETYLLAHENILAPINGPDLWPHTNLPPLNEPYVEPQVGRPKTNRNKKNDDKKKQGKLTKNRVAMHCSGCGGIGHNLRSCKGEGNMRPARNNAGGNNAATSPRRENNAARNNVKRSRNGAGTSRPSQASAQSQVIN